MTAGLRTTGRRAAAATILIGTSMPIGLGPASGASPDRRLVEGVALLRQQFAGNASDDGLQRCSIGAEWYPSPIPEKTARSFLGLSTGKRDHPPTPRDARGLLKEIVGDPASVCTTEEAESYLAVRLRDLAPGRSVDLQRSLIGFPLLSRDGTKAALVSSHWVISKTRTVDGVKGLPVSGDTVLRLFEKRAGRWVQISGDELDVT